MKSTQPDAIALAGMPSYLAELGSWAKVMPASPLIAARPRVPSEAVPERMTPIASCPCPTASDRRKVSMVVLAELRLLSLAQMQHPVRDRHFTIRRNNVDVIGRDLRALCHLQHGHPGRAAKYLGYCALPGRVQMEYDDESHAQVWR